jgi:hypothetical protein
MRGREGDDCGKHARHGQLPGVVQELRVGAQVGLAVAGRQASAVGTAVKAWV